MGVVVMNLIKNFASGAVESLAIVIGLSAIILATAFWFLGHVVAPALIGYTWEPLSAFTHWGSMLIGLALLSWGSLNSVRLPMKKIDLRYTAVAHMIYKVAKWVLKFAFKLVWFLVTTAFYAWIGHRPSGKTTETHAQATADDIWDSHPKHYYDNEPPKPFS